MKLELEKQLLTACKDRRLDEVRRLVNEQRADLSCRDSDGNTPLHLACGYGHTEIVRFLTVDKQCDAEYGNNNQETPLHRAALWGHLNIVKLLIDDVHCDPTVKGQYGRTPLHHACQEGHLDITKYLIDEVHVDPMCKDDDLGSTPLHVASSFGHTHIVRFLTIERQMDAECRDNDQNTPLNYAALGGHLDIVKLLIDDVHCDPTVKGRYGRTPLHSACDRGHLDITKYLIDKVHVDPMCKDHEKGSTPLHLASQFGHTHIVRFLTIERQMDAECRNNYQNTPLHRAAFGGHLEIVKLLVDDLHCDPTVKGQYGRTPLHVACQEGHLDIAKYLIDEQHVDPLYQDKYNVTPLHMAALNGHTEVMKYLVGDKKCDPRPKTKKGKTPYDLARQSVHMDVALYLESQGGGPSGGPTSTISPTHTPTGSHKTGGALSQSPSSLLRRGNTPPQEHREPSEKTGTMSSPTPHIEMEQLNRKLAKEVQEYKTALVHSQQTQQSLTQALAEKELQLSLRPAKMVDLQATLEQQGAQLHKERSQREEAEKQLKTNQRELHDMQQKVDELQEEKEKLEGQLQSTQDSIKEIQEQLTPPEKSVQAIQTPGEPSYLQTSAQMLDKEREFQATLEQRETQLDWERRRREEVEQQFKENQRKLNEMQLQLQEREKLAGQSTGEAATTTMEIQEQLTPPERRNQSVQTYTEPPLLQTSEATQATGEAAITTKEIQGQLTPPEKRDKTYTEPPLLQTSEVFHVRGVHVVGETTFTATRHSTILNWEEYGFMLHIPEGALPPGVEQCHIHVKATTRGQFQLPDDHELVSAVFWVWCRHKLSKPATMEIEHCAAITTDKQCSALTFVRTQCSQEKLPYTFKPVPEGVFTPGSCFGSLSLSRFSGYGIASRKRPRRKGSAASAKRRKHDYSSLTPSLEAVSPETVLPVPASGETKPTSAEETSPTEIVPSDLESSPARSPDPRMVESDQEEEKDTKRYCAQLYCAYKGGRWWLLYFVLIRHLKADLQDVKTYFFGKATLEIESSKLTLEKDEIALDIPSEGVTQEGWKVMPCYCPTITKEDAHHFISGSSTPALCELQAEWQDDQRRPHCLNYLTKIIGARPPRNYFLLTVTPVIETGQDTAMSPKSLSQDSSGWQSLSPPRDGPFTGASIDVHHPVFEQQSFQDTMRRSKAFSQDGSDHQPPAPSGGNSQIQSPKSLQERSETTLSLTDLVILRDRLKDAISHWKEIGLNLGFIDGELDSIEHTPALSIEGPPGYMRKLLSQWLKWAPPTHSWPTVEALASALRRAGEEAVAFNLIDRFEAARNGKPSDKEFCVPSSETRAGVPPSKRPAVIRVGHGQSPAKSVTLSRKRPATVTFATAATVPPPTILAGGEGATAIKQQVQTKPEESGAAAASGAFRKCYAVLHMAIGEPEDLASELYSSDVISEEIIDKVCLPGLTPREKNSVLLSAIRDQIAVDTSKFHKVLETLKENKAMAKIAKRLETTYRELVHK